MQQKIKNTVGFGGLLFFAFILKAQDDDALAFDMAVSKKAWHKW